jgi:hypothetical protein
MKTKIPDLVTYILEKKNAYIKDIIGKVHTILKGSNCYKKSIIE